MTNLDDAATAADRPPRLAIIGCGLIGRKRAAALAPGQLAVACDLDRDRAEALARAAGAGARASVRVDDAVGDPAVEAVVVCTLNGSLAGVAAAALRAGKPVLVEKPAAVSVAEVDLLQALARAVDPPLPVRVGYNHRYHPAIQRARALVDAGALGPLLFVRGRYGHGGRVGYDREWRADPAQSGGGELIDQGVHLIDLAGWFLGEFTEVAGHAATYFWDMPVDDNAFLSLRTAAGQTAWLHVSCTEWKNLFSLEITGRDGKLHVEGLGGSYGVERLTHYRMLPEMGPPETTSWEYPRGDESWTQELRAFAADVRGRRVPVPGLREARAALAVVEHVYRRSGYPRPSSAAP